MKYQHNKFNIALKMFFFLSLGGIVFNSISQLPRKGRTPWDCPIADEVMLEMVTVEVLGGGFYEQCKDTIIIDNINLHASRTDCRMHGSGCGSLRVGRIVLTDTDTLIFNACRPIENLWWTKGRNTYPVRIYSAFLQKLNDAVMSLEEDLSKTLRRDCNSLWTPDLEIE